MMDGKLEEFYTASSSHEEVRDTNSSYKRSYDICPDQTLHQRFIPVDKFDLSYNIQKTCHGTGFIQRIKRQSGKLCPCSDCEKREDKDRFKSWFKLSITTVRSVFKRFDFMGVPYAKEELFYDNESSCDRNQTQCVEIVSREILGDECEDGVKIDGIDDDWRVCFGVAHGGELIDDLVKCLDDYEKQQEAAHRWYKTGSGGSKLAVIVGHPHGGPKMVTVGQEPRRIDIRNIRSSQVLCRYAYDAVTCPGSGGSPVYVCGQPICGFGYWFGHPHNHARGYTQRSGDVIRQYNFSSVGVDHLE
ncbi:hypothetical protein Btru_002489 [Bulinus truncatus]|nr:hypothetical protein Btru_002489 [Bulinus truncatus]